MIRSASTRRVLYSCAVNAFGLYPAALFSWAAIPCTCCAASNPIGPIIADAAIAFRSSRRDVSDISLPHFFGHVLSGAPSQRDDRECWVLVWIADKRRGVGDEQVLHLVRLAVLVQHRRRRIVAHPNGAEFMNNFAASGNAFAGHEVRLRLGHGAAHSFEQ